MATNTGKECSVCRKIKQNFNEAGLRFKGGREDICTDKSKETRESYEEVREIEDYDDAHFTRRSTYRQTPPPQPDKKQKSKKSSCCGKKAKKEEPYEPAQRRDSRNDRNREGFNNVPDNDRIEQLERKVENLTNQLRRLSEQRNEEVEHTGKEEEKVKNLQRRISCLAEQLATLKESTSLDDRVRSLQKQMSGLLDEMDALKETAAMEDSVKCLQDQLKCLAEEVSALQDDKELEMNVKCLQQQVEEIACGLNALRESDVLEKKVKSLQAQINCLADETTDLRDNHPLLKELSLLQQCINDLAMEVSLIKDNDSTENKVKILNDYMVELSEQINELKDNDEVEEKVKDLQIQMRALVVQLDQVMENAALEEKVNCLKKQVSNLFNDRHAKEKSENLERTRELQNEITLIKQEMTKIKGGDNLEERIATLQEQIIMLLKAQKEKAATNCKSMGMQRVNGRDSYYAGERRSSAQKAMARRKSGSSDETESPTQRRYCGKAFQARRDSLPRRKSGNDRRRAPRTPSEPKPTRKREFSHVANEAQRSRSLQRNNPRSIEKVTKIEYFERPREKVKPQIAERIKAKEVETEMKKDYLKEQKARIADSEKEVERLKGASDVAQKERIRALKEADKEEGMNVYRRRRWLRDQTPENKSNNPRKEPAPEADEDEEYEVQRKARRRSNRRLSRSAEALEPEEEDNSKARARRISEEARTLEDDMEDAVVKKDEYRSIRPRGSSKCGRMADDFENYRRRNIRLPPDSSMAADAMQDTEAKPRARRILSGAKELEDELEDISDDEFENRNSKRYSAARTCTCQKAEEPPIIRDSRELVPARLRRRETEETLEDVDEDQSLDWDQNARKSNARSRYSDADNMQNVRCLENDAEARDRSWEQARQRELRTSATRKSSNELAGETRDMRYTTEYERSKYESMRRFAQDNERGEVWKNCMGADDIRENEKYKRLQNNKLSEDASALIEVIEDPRAKARVERISRSAKELEDSLEDVIEVEMAEKRKRTKCRDKIREISLYGTNAQGSMRQCADENVEPRERKRYTTKNLEEASERKRAKDYTWSDIENECGNEDLAAGGYRQSGGTRAQSNKRRENENAGFEGKLQDYQNAAARRRRARDTEDLKEADKTKAAKRQVDQDFKLRSERRQRIRSGNEMINALLKQNRNRKGYAEVHSEDAEASSEESELEPEPKSSCCSLCEAIYKLIGKNEPHDVALKVILEKDGIHHINATLRKNGATIGCISATDKAVEDAKAQKFFKQFLSFFINNPDDKQLDKNVTLK